VQGIIGIGGEKQGELHVLVENPSKQIKVSDITTDLKDKIIVCGSYIDLDIYDKAKSLGVQGIVCGGVDYNSISKILGYSLGVAITGTEETTTLILTEGFGKIDMALRTFNILKENNNKYVSINGATQIRAGVLRPEIFIKSDGSGESKKITEDDLIISEGSTVRVIREPFFGKIGKIVSLPYELVQMKSETKVRVAEIQFEDKTKEIIPRANLEVILSN
jgi:transcription antitermination factor NusG